MSLQYYCHHNNIVLCAQVYYRRITFLLCHDKPALASSSRPHAAPVNDRRRAADARTTYYYTTVCTPTTTTTTTTTHYRRYYYYYTALRVGGGAGVYCLFARRRVSARQLISVFTARRAVPGNNGRAPRATVFSAMHAPDTVLPILLSPLFSRPAIQSSGRTLLRRSKKTFRRNVIIAWKKQKLDWISNATPPPARQPLCEGYKYTNC